MNSTTINLCLFLLLFSSSLVGSIFAQNTFSPWTSYGIGERNSTDHGTFTALGNNKITYFDSTTLNYYNPASYNTLSNGMPLYSVGLNSRYTQISANGNQDWNFNLLPDHFVMAFGLKKHFGFAFGLKPFTKKGFEITDRTKVGDDSIKYIYSGKGGTQEVFLGLSSDLIHTKTTRLAIGGNIGYVFGTATNERKSILIEGNNNIGGIDWKESKLHDIHYDLSAYLTQQLGSNQSVTFTIALEPKQQLNALENNYLFYGNTDDPELYDTLFSQTAQNSSIHLGGHLQTGFVWKHQFNDKRKDNSSRKSEIALFLNHQKPLSLGDSSSNLMRLANGWNMGFQYTPQISYQDNTSTNNILEKIRYRLGYYQLVLPYQINGAKLREEGFTLGFGFPVTSFRTLSSVNLSVLAGRRTETSLNMYNENFLGFSFGIILAPSSFDKWFVKRKLD